MSQLPTAAAETPERLLALHRSGSSGRQWGAWLPTLGERCGGVITPELMGYAGNEAWPAGRRVTLDDEAAALAPLLAEGPVHLLGHSYGAAVALQLALRCPSRVRSLTLYEPVRFGLLLQQQGQPRALGQSVVMVARRIGLHVMAGALDAAAERFVDYWSGIGSWQQMKPAAQQNLAHRMPKVHNEFLALFGDNVPAADWSRLTMPVRLAGGTRSPAPVRAILDRLQQLLPQATRESFEGLGHMGPVAAPARVMAALYAPAPEPFPQAA